MTGVASPLVATIPTARRRDRAAVWLSRLAVLAVLAGAPARANAGESAGTPAVAVMLASGDSALARLNLDAATAAYARAHRAEPNNYEAAWKLARAFADRATLSPQPADQRARCVEAESLARAAIAVRPGGAEGHAFLAIALGKRALFEGGKRKVQLSHEIKSEADTALALDANSDLAHHVLGVWNREVVALPGALRFFATMLYGKLPTASLEDALEHLRSATRLRPDVLPHHVELGITLAAARRYPEARAELEHALSMPTSWVTDDFYRTKARNALESVRRHVR